MDPNGVKRCTCVGRSGVARLVVQLQERSADRVIRTDALEVVEDRVDRPRDHAHVLGAGDIPLHLY